MGTGPSGLWLQAGTSAPKWHTQLIERSEEGGKPAINRQECECDPPARLHFLGRDHDKDALSIAVVSVRGLPDDIVFIDSLDGQAISHAFASERARKCGGVTNQE